MAWIEVHQALRDHRKVWALAAELDMPEAHVSGHVIYLWLWGLDSAQDGVLPKSIPVIERAAGWTGERGKFVRSLIASGFVDEAEDGTLSLHDWDIYTGRLIGKRMADAQRKRDQRASAGHPTDIPGTSDGHPRDGAGTNKQTQQTEHTDTHAPRHADNITPFKPPTPDPEPEGATAPPARVKVSARKSATPSEKKPPAKRGQNEQWDALVDVLYQPETKAECSNFGRVARNLREAGATGDEIRRRAENHRIMRESGVIPWDLTLNAFENHWTELKDIRAPRNSNALKPRPTGTDGPVYGQIARLE